MQTVLKRLGSWRPVQVLMAYGASQGGNYAASLSYNAFLAMFPLILGILSIIGLAVKDPGVQKTLYTGIVSVFPSDAHAQILQTLEGVKHNAGILGILSILGLLWSGTSLLHPWSSPSHRSSAPSSGTCFGNAPWG